MPSFVERHSLGGDERLLELVLPGERSLVFEAVAGKLLVVKCEKADEWTDVFAVDMPSRLEEPEDFMALDGDCTDDTHIAQINHLEHHPVDACSVDAGDEPSLLVMRHEVSLSPN